MFFEQFSKLCKQKSVSRYQACVDIGLNRSAVDKWRKGAVPTGSTLHKLAEYFGVTTDFLLGIHHEQEKVKEGLEIKEEDIRAAFFHNVEDLSEEEIKAYWDDAKDYIAYKIEQKRRQKVESTD